MRVTETDRDWAVKADHEREDLEAAGYDPDWSEEDYRSMDWRG